MICWHSLQTAEDQYILKKHDSVTLKPNDVSFQDVWATVVFVCWF